MLNVQIICLCKLSGENSSIKYVWVVSYIVHKSCSDVLLLKFQFLKISLFYRYIILTRSLNFYYTMTNQFLRDSFTTAVQLSYDCYGLIALNDYPLWHVWQDFVFSHYFSLSIPCLSHWVSLEAVFHVMLFSRSLCNSCPTYLTCVTYLGVSSWHIWAGRKE